MNYYFDDDEDEEIWTTGRLIEQPKALNSRP